MSVPLTAASGARSSQVAVVATATIFGLTYGLSAPLIALELDRRGLGETLIGLNAAMYALGVLAVATFLPPLAARLGARIVMLLALASVAIVLPLFSFVPWLLLWFPLRFVMGMASEGVFVMSEAWVNQLSDERTRARSIATYTATLSLGFALGPLILNAVGSEGAVPYLIGGGLALLAMVAILPRSVRAPHFEEAASLSAKGMFSVARLAPVAMAATAMNSALETAGVVPAAVRDPPWLDRDRSHDPDLYADDRRHRAAAADRLAGRSPRSSPAHSAVFDSAMEATRHGLPIFAALVCASFATLAWRKRWSE